MELYYGETLNSRKAACGVAIRSASGGREAAPVTRL
jgi:hypothetical protein